MNIVRAVPSISRIACCSEPPRRDQVIPLGGEELQPLGLLGVLLDRQRIDWSDALQGLDDTLRLVLQRLEIQLQHRSLGQQRIERLPPFRLDPLDNRTPPAGGLGHLDLQPMVLLGQLLDAFPSRVKALLRLGQGLLRPQGGRVGLECRGLQLVHCDTTLSP